MNWSKCLPKDTIETLGNFHLLKHFILKNILCVAFFYVTMKFQNSVIDTALNFRLHTPNNPPESAGECDYIARGGLDVTKDGILVQIIHLPSRLNKALEGGGQF